MDQNTFELICKLKDTNPTNLNDLFESYGCSTLEATVPVVTDQVVEKLKEVNSEQQMYATLALKTESVDLMRRGRMAKTKDRTLTIVGMNGQTMIATGPERSRSPTPDKDELDDEIEQYMKERKRLKAQAQGIKVEDEWPEEKPMIRPVAVSKGQRLPPAPSLLPGSKNTLVTKDDLDTDLDSYMIETRRQKRQNKAMSNLSERMTQMEALEDIFESDL